MAVQMRGLSNSEEMESSEFWIYRARLKRADEPKAHGTQAEPEIIKTTGSLSVGLHSGSVQGNTYRSITAEACFLII